MRSNPFSLDEDELRGQIEEHLLKQYRKTGLQLLAYVYTLDPDDIDPDPKYSIPRGELGMVRGEKDAMEAIEYQLKNIGRTGVLYFLVGNLKHIHPDDEEHMLLLFVELSECKHLLDFNEPFAALIRGATFLEKVLGERLSSANKLAHLIQEASDEGVISTKQEQLAQFIRECRNDAGHNFWLDTEFSYVVHEHGVLTLICLLDSLLKNWYRRRWDPVTPQLSTDRCLRIIRGEFGFIWQKDSGLRQWNSNSMNERYDRRQ